MPEKLFSGKWWRGNELGGVVTLKQWYFCCGRNAFQVWSKPATGVRISWVEVSTFCSKVPCLKRQKCSKPTLFSNKGEQPLLLERCSDLAHVHWNGHHGATAFGDSASCGRCLCTTKQCRHGWEVDFRLTCKFRNRNQVLIGGRFCWWLRKLSWSGGFASRLVGWIRAGLRQFFKETQRWDRESGMMN